MNKLISKETKWLYQIANKKKRYVGVLILIQTLLSICGVFYALLLRGAIDEAEHHNTEGFFLYFGCIIAFVAVQITLRAVERYMEEYVRSRLENACKKRLFHHLLKKDFSSVTEVHSGEWMNRLTSDTVVCANGIVDLLPKVIGMGVKLVAAFIAIVILEPKFGWVLVPAGILLILFSTLFRKTLRKLHKGVQEQDGTVRVYLQERISSLLVLKAFSAERRSEEEAAKKMQAHKSARMKKSNFSNLCNIGLGVLMNGLYLFAGVGYCGYGIATGQIGYGTFIAMLQLISQIQTPFANISGFMPRFYAMLASAERLMEVEEYADDSSDAIFTQAHVNAFYQKQFTGIALDEVSFAYSMSGEGEEIPVVLKDLSLAIQKGDYVALTGQSGCGKSTTLKLLLSLYPLDSGSCSLHTEAEVTVLTGEWRRLFAYVPQGNYLMCGTIRNLITFGEEASKAQEEKLHAALKISCADEFVSELEDGVDTELGEKGHGLSEGQMQRLAIARAIYSNRPILLLDEATSALDEETECRLLDNLKEMTDKTVIIVTHRMKALDICNKIANFTEDGVSVETK